MIKRTGIFNKTDNVELRLEQLEIHKRGLFVDFATIHFNIT